MLTFIPVAPGWLVLIFLGGAGVAGWFAFRFHRVRLAVAAARPVPIGDAVAGRVALIGQSEPAGGAPLQAPLSGQPCVWYSYRVEERRIERRNDRDEEKWVETSSGVSGAPIILRDQTGAARIEPQDAEMSGVPQRTWTGNSPWPAGRQPPGGSAEGWMNTVSTVLNAFGTWRYTEEIIPPGAMLFVIGAMAPQGEARFEGVEQLDERNRAVAASRAVPKVVRAPDSGPFIISAEPPEATGRRYRRNAWLVTTGAVLAAAVAGLLMLRWIT